MPSRVLFVGVGSPHGDDRIGWLVADELRQWAASETPAGNSPAIRKASSPADLLDWLEDVDRLVVCDACSANGSPGTSTRWVWPEPSVRRAHAAGTHQLSLVDALDLATSLHRLPEEVILWGVQAGSVEPQDELSHSVAAALPALVERIRGDLLRA